MNGQHSNAQIFDVFLCHNSEDKPAVRKIAENLSKENIKPWLDEADIKSGSFWHSAIGEQIETVKSAAVFVGQHGVGPWQSREIIALLDEFDKRGCAVIPAILPSDPPKPVVLPWSLKGLHCVDFRATNSHPLQRLIWGITGQKPAELSNVPDSEKPATTQEADKGQLLPSADEHAAAQKVHSGDSRLYPRLTKPPDQDQATQLEILRRRVTEGWVDGVLGDFLKNQPSISLRKRKIDRAIDAPWKHPAQPSDSTSPAPLDGRDLNTVYDATGLLLILGEPGSGKTTTLLELARTLLQRAEKDIKERVPVVLNLSSWKKKQSLTKWISGELSEKYRVPRKIALFWIQQNYLLPLLDGLDEVPTALQPDCVAAMNAFIDEFNPPGLVVCCRLNEYRWLPERLKLNGAIRLEPLSKAQIDDYLASGGSKMDALREAVNTDSVLQELAQAPLMLSIMSLASQGTRGDELVGQKGDSPEERRNRIFRLYIDQMFQRNGTASLLFPKEKIIGWLSWLAMKMREHAKSVFLVEGLQPSWLANTGQQIFYRAVAALIIGLLVVMIAGLSLGVMWGLIFGLGIIVGIGVGCGSRSLVQNAIFSGLISALITAIIRTPEGLISNLGPVLFSAVGAAVIGGLGAGSLKHLTLVESMSWKWNQFWKWALPGFGLGVCLFIIGWLSVWLSGLHLPLSLTDLQIGILFFGLPTGLVGGIVGGFTETVRAEKASPNEGINLSLRNCAIVGVSTGFMVGSVLLLIGWLWPKRRTDHNLVLLVGFLVGLIVGFNRGGSAVIKHYVLRLTLCLNGYTPFKFIKFLDQCARLILLKKVGGGYIFLHRMLLEYFADIPPQDISVKR